MQEVDAERRIQLLREIRPDPLPETDEPSTKASHHTRHDGRPDRKRRRLTGEDDTDRDLRIARENNEAASKSAQALATVPKTSDAPLTDAKGHINLFPEEGSKRRAPKNAEAEAETAKKKKEYEDQYTMRFSNAAGFKESISQKPWYSSTGNIRPEENTEEAVTKDVWGNEDPRRKERAQKKLIADDPMAIIQKGVSDLRQVERERKKWQIERDNEMNEFIESEKRRERKKRRRRAKEDELEGFSLDEPPHKSDDKRRHRDGHSGEDRSHRRSSKERHHSQHRQRSHERSRRRSEPGHHQHINGNHGTRHVNTHSPPSGSQIPIPPDEQVGWRKSSGSRYSSQFAHC